MTKTASIHGDENDEPQIIVSGAGSLLQHVIKKFFGPHNNVRIGRELLSLVSNKVKNTHIFEILPVFNRQFFIQNDMVTSRSECGDM